MKLLLIVFLFIFSHQALSGECLLEKPTGTYTPKYAKNFNITYYSHFTLLSTGPRNDQVLVADGALKCETTIPVFKKDPLRVIATSTTHLPILTFLGLENRLVGFQGTNYISNKKFLAKPMTNINYQLNAEELLKLNADIIFTYAANIPFWKTAKDYHQLKIPIVLIWDFIETHPLARAEWMVLQAHLLNKSKEAIAHFDLIEKNYNETKQSINIKIKTRVLVGDIQNGKWVTCGGRSDLARLISDAGGVLVLDNDKTETQFIAIEKVLYTTIMPDVWLPQNNWQNQESQLKDVRYKKYSSLPVYNNNKLVNSNGFNDYWESGVARPDLVLKDLAKILHSQNVDEDHLKWFKRIK